MKAFDVLVVKRRKTYRNLIIKPKYIYELSICMSTIV